MQEREWPYAFVARKLHSITGLFLALFLFIHLLTNSQAALYLGEQGKGFVKMVNSIHDLPFLLFIEIFLLGVPILIHMVWGVKILREAKQNSYVISRNEPYQPQARNQAYTWQRITSWILLFGLLGHIVHMRIMEYPEKIKEEGKEQYLVTVSEDPNLTPLADFWDVEVIRDQEKSPDEVVLKAPDFGTADLFVVRNAFKNPVLVALYTLFVLSACFHAYNGLWTFLISWGVTVTEKSQLYFGYFCYGLMVLVAFFGLLAIFGSVYGVYYETI